MVSGHYGSMLSEYASKNLTKEVDVQISAVIAKNPNILGDAIPKCLVDTIQKFDATLQSTMIEKMREMDPMPWSEWTKDDIPRFLGMKEMGEHDPYPIMRRACAGTTVLIAVIIEHNVWVASLGDSEGCKSTSSSLKSYVTSSFIDLGRFVSNSWTATPMNDFHNLHNAAEVQRLQEEHPGEDDLIVYHRTKGQLGISRGMHNRCNAFSELTQIYGTYLALGDAIFKVPIDLARVLGMMWGCPIFPETMNQWIRQKHTPPYISSTPSVMHFSFEKGDLLVFCSDGVGSALKEQGVPDQDVANTIISLAGMDLLDAESLLSYEKAIGHSFIPSSDINNISDRMIRNVLFGLDNHRMAKETMAIMDSRPNYLRDDMSVVVVEIL